MQRLIATFFLAACVLMATSGAANLRAAGKGPKDGTYSGPVQKRTDKNISIFNDGSQIARQFVFADNMEVIINGKASTIGHIVHNDNVTLTVAGGKVTKVECSR